MSEIIIDRKDTIEVDTYSGNKNGEGVESGIPEYAELQYFIRRRATIDLLIKKGIKHFFPIQYQTYDAINFRKDLIGRDRTGSGKTIAYSLPVLERLRDTCNFQSSRHVKFLILLPTRELVSQVSSEIEGLKLTTNEFQIAAIYGGVLIGPQIKCLQSKTDVIVATPGRLLDLFRKKMIQLTNLETFCLDEADEMLKLGFQADVEQIFAHISQLCPKRNQILLFSATIPIWVKELADKFLAKNKRFIDLIGSEDVKTSLTVDHLSFQCQPYQSQRHFASLATLYAGSRGSVIIFCDTKRQAGQIFEAVKEKNQTHILHGDISQPEREKTFQMFKKGQIRMLVATNIAARGLDIPGVDLVIQLKPPHVVEQYVHRAGRTGRAGKSGTSITFYTSSEKYLLKQIQNALHIQFADIYPPKPQDLLKAATQDTVNSIRNVKEDALEIYGGIADSLIAEMGDRKALCLAIGYIFKHAGVEKDSKRQVSFFSCILSSELQFTESEGLSFLRNEFGNRMVAEFKTVRKLSGKELVFGIDERYREQINEFIEKNGKSTESQFDLQIKNPSAAPKKQCHSNNSRQAYDKALKNKDKLEVFVAGFGSKVDERTLEEFMRQNNVGVISIRMIKNQTGESRGFGFIFCLSEQDVIRALDLDGRMLESRKLSVKPKSK